MKKILFDPGMVLPHWATLNRQIDALINTPLLQDVQQSQVAVSFLRVALIFSLLLAARVLIRLIQVMPTRTPGQTLLTFLRTPWYRPALALLAVGVVVLAMMLTLLIGTPGLAALAVATSALIAGLRGAGALAGLLMLPLAVPLLIFGGGALDPAAGVGALKLLGAVSLVLVAGAPFVAGAAIRVAME